MKKLQLLKNQKKKVPTVSHQLAFQGGAYSLAITAIVLAILIVLNLFASALPTNLTKYDISSSKLYSITSNTKVVVNALTDDVTIYWVVQADAEDDVIENLLEKYESLSDHIRVVKKNPDVYPTFTQQYTDETVPNNSLIVECGDRNRYISYEDIYVTEMDMNSYSYDSSFDGEGAITSAIDYVTNEEQPQLYLLEGHGESALPETFSNQMTKENIELNTFSLLNTDAVPEEADCVLIYAPTSDLSGEEVKLLKDYADNGGKLLVMAGPTKDGMLENLYSLLEEYGVHSEYGVVIEQDREFYAFQAPQILLPEIAENEITEPLLEETYYAIMPVAQGLTIEENSVNVTPLLTSSVTSFSKAAGYSLETYDKEDGDTDGPFALAVSIDCGSEGQIVWVASSYFLDDMYNAYSSGANVEFTLNALSSMLGETEAVSIRSKSLNYNYLTISDSTASMMKVIMIGIIPIAYLGVGIVIMLKRRMENEAS